MSKVIDVVGAVIIRDGLVLCAQRPEGGRQAGLWEFPGGKIEPDETPQEALQREIREELLCEVSVGEKVITSDYAYEFGTVRLTTYICVIDSGDPIAAEHSKLVWERPVGLASFQWAPVDVPAVKKIQEWLLPA